MVIPGVVAFLLAVFERFSKIRFKSSPLFRRYFISDVMRPKPKIATWGLSSLSGIG